MECIGHPGRARDVVADGHHVIDPPQVLNAFRPDREVDGRQHGVGQQGGRRGADREPFETARVEPAEHGEHPIDIGGPPAETLQRVSDDLDPNGREARLDVADEDRRFRASGQACPHGPTEDPACSSPIVQAHLASLHLRSIGQDLEPEPCFDRRGDPSDDGGIGAVTLGIEYRDVPGSPARPVNADGRYRFTRPKHGESGGLDGLQGSS